MRSTAPITAPNRAATCDDADQRQLQNAHPPLTGTARIADLVRHRQGTARVAGQMQIRRFCVR
jgi:hypothetical protein